MATLTTHVLNVADGTPAAGVRIELRCVDRSYEPPRSMQTNIDGRCATPLLQGDQLQAGRYELKFHIAEYFRALGVTLSEPPFLDEVVIAFGIAIPAQNYHVPLLVSPWSYSTYRGS